MPFHTDSALRALLDDSAAMRALDPDGMMGLTTGFPAQCREAVRIGAEFTAKLPPTGPIQNVVVTGLGGSAIGGDLLRCLVEEYGDVPLVVNRDYTLPGFVNNQTLVLAASYSGNTEETLSAYAMARARRAQIVCVTSGGDLAGRGEADGVPVCRIPGSRPPRASTGFLFFPMLAVIAQRGLLGRAPTGAVEETIALLERLSGAYGPGTPTENNPAKRLALALYERIPVLYGSQGYRGVVALRWKGQFNENAKQHAFAYAFPEQNHNEILGWTLASRQSERWSVVYLRDPAEKTETPRIARRVEVTQEIIGQAAQQHEVWAEGDSLLAKMFSLIYFGDFVSVYTAYLNGIDPTDITSINRLKAEMQKMGA